MSHLCAEHWFMVYESSSPSMALSGLRASLLDATTLAPSAATHAPQHTSTRAGGVGADGASSATPVRLSFRQAKRIQWKSPRAPHGKGGPRTHAAPAAARLMRRSSEGASSSPPPAPSADPSTWASRSSALAPPASAPPAPDTTSPTATASPEGGVEGAPLPWCGGGGGAGGAAPAAGLASAATSSAAQAKSSGGGMSRRGRAAAAGSPCGTLGCGVSAGPAGCAPPGGARLGLACWGALGGVEGSSTGCTTLSPLVLGSYGGGCGMPSACWFGGASGAVVACWREAGVTCAALSPSSGGDPLVASRLWAVARWWCGCAFLRQGGAGMEGGVGTLGGPLRCGTPCRCPAPGCAGGGGASPPSMWRCCSRPCAAAICDDVAAGAPRWPHWPSSPAASAAHRDDAVTGSFPSTRSVAPRGGGAAPPARASPAGEAPARPCCDAAASATAPARVPEERLPRRRVWDALWVAVAGGVS